MSKLNFAAALLVLASLSMISCKKDNGTPAASCTNNTQWIKPGHQFVYENFPILIMADTLYVDLVEELPGTFKSTSKFDDGTSYPTQVTYLQPCDNSIYQALDVTLSNKQEIYRIDGNVGDSWTNVTTSTGGNSVTTTTTIAAKNVSVTVPAGTFSCIQFHNVATSSAAGSITVETEIYLDNNAGLVKAEGNTAHYELVRKNY
jgi:hypothetical protein